MWTKCIYMHMCTQRQRGNKHTKTEIQPMVARLYYKPYTHTHTQFFVNSILNQSYNFTHCLMSFSQVLTNVPSSTCSLSSLPHLRLASLTFISFATPSSPSPRSPVHFLFLFLYFSFFIFSHLSFLWKHKKERRGTNGRNNGRRGGYSLWICAYASLLMFWFAFVCSCLPLLFSVTLGRPAGLEQQPAEA